MTTSDLAPDALERAAAAICAVRSKGVCPREGCVNCTNSDEYGFKPEARAAILAYLAIYNPAELEVIAEHRRSANAAAKQEADRRGISVDPRIMERLSNAEAAIAEIRRLYLTKQQIGRNQLYAVLAANHVNTDSVPIDALTAREPGVTGKGEK